MNTEPAAASSGQRFYWRANILAALTAAIISIGLTKIGLRLSWPHPTAISFAVFIFLIPVLPPLFGDKRQRNWPQTLIFAGVAALMLGYFQLLLD